jgi:hypothetical protein
VQLIRPLLHGRLALIRLEKCSRPASLLGPTSLPAALGNCSPPPAHEVDPAFWKLHASSPSCRTPCAATVANANPSPPLHCSGTSLHCSGAQSLQPQPLPCSMAFQRADPLPFVPQGFQYQDVPNRVFMVFAVAPVRPLEMKTSASSPSTPYLVMP